jgi:hypothetical protein
VSRFYAMEPDGPDRAGPDNGEVERESDPHTTSQLDAAVGVLLHACHTLAEQLAPILPTAVAGSISIP